MIQATTDLPEVAQRARARELTGQALADALSRERDRSGIDLSGADLDGADLTGTMLFKATLKGTSLRGARLDGVELSGSDLEGADLEGAHLVGAGLGMAVLRGVNGFNADLTGATLTGADLTEANLQCATLRDARVREATLDRVDLRAADVRSAELSLCSVAGANFDDADLRGARLRSIRGFESASWFGVDLRDVNFAGAYRLRRHVVDENYLREFREVGPLQNALYNVWWITSDCGRSLGRWIALIIVVATLFAGLYAVAGVDTGPHAATAMTHFYYSVVTLTSLGYGEILPASGFAQLLVILEVCTGYMMLGGLISILANKMARRGE